jgi:hypothetical protein
MSRRPAQETNASVVLRRIEGLPTTDGMVRILRPRLPYIPARASEKPHFSSFVYAMPSTAQFAVAGFEDA